MNRTARKRRPARVSRRGPKNALKVETLRLHLDWPLGARLKVPKSWAADAGCRRKALIPAGLTFGAKPALALALLHRARRARVAPWQ